MEIQDLQQFAKNLGGTNYGCFVKDVKTAIDKMFRLLREEPLISVNRCSLVGGLAKKTSTPLKADADIVIFYNDKGQDRESIVQAIQNVLLKNEIQITSSVMTTKNGVMKFIMDGISFDMLVAQNYATDSSNVIEEQRRYSMLRLKMSGDYKSNFGQLGIELTESSVAFMKEKTPFVHELAKLAKYWNQMMLFKEYIYGRSTIMELLATKAGLEEENNYHNPSFLNAFKRFLEKIIKIEEVHIIFEDYYRKTEIPTEILSQTPLLMDPVNPYNNLLGGECGYGYGKMNTLSENMKNFMSFMSNAAKVSLDMINRCSDITKIFSPHPPLYQLKTKDKWLAPRKDEYTVAVFPNHHPEIQDPRHMSDSMPGYILWNAKGNEFKDDIDAILKVYAGSIYNHTKTKKNSSDRENKNAVEVTIDENNGVAAREWYSAVDTRAFNQYDITMKVPIENDRSVCISFDFDCPVD